MAGPPPLDGHTYQLEFEDLRLAGFRPVCVSGCGTYAGDRSGGADVGPGL
jgi:hypothetical protein